MREFLKDQNMFFNRLTALFPGVVICCASFCQVTKPDIKFGDLTPEDFAASYYSIDSSADAIYLYDAGSSHFESGAIGGVFLVYTEHKRIRLLHKNGFNVASTKIYLFDHGSTSDELEDLQAATYTLENGKITVSKVDKTSIFKTKQGNIQSVTFTFPNLTEGCIVEYSYKETIPTYSYIPAWSFQNSFPHLWSEYSVEVPQFLDFVTLNQGYIEPVLDTGSTAASDFTFVIRDYRGGTRLNTFRSTTVKHTWAFQNVPAVKEESYITNLSNYIEQIEFQLQAIRIPGEQPKFFMNDWNETSKQLMKEENFGYELTKENHYLKDAIQVATAGSADQFDKARRIFDFVRQNYFCFNHSAISLSQPLRKTYDTKRGNVADINILLLAMLRYAGFTADPVLLSTRQNGKTYDVYPILSKYNYVIVKIEFDDQFYLLDASDNKIAFGFLPPACFNDNGIVIAQPSSEINLSSDSLDEQSLVSVFLTNDSNGISGSCKTVLGTVESYNVRNKLVTSSKDEYLKELFTKGSFDINVSDPTIDSLQQLQYPVSTQYNINFNLTGDLFYFNPMFADPRKENPFHAANRSFPVEMPYCMDKTYVLNMQIPEGYYVEELPKPARATLNDNEGMFEYIIEQSNDRLQLQCRVKLNKANFESNDYQTLRNFFTIIVDKENEQIVFKKQQ